MESLVLNLKTPRPALLLALVLIPGVGSQHTQQIMIAAAWLAVLLCLFRRDPATAVQPARAARLIVAGVACAAAAAAVRFGMPLTAKQQAFIDHYVQHFNATRAAKEAGALAYRPVGQAEAGRRLA